MTKRNPADFSEADHNLGDMLDSLARADNYLNFIVDLMAPHLGNSVLEIGSGLGDLTRRLANNRDVVATDVSEKCLMHLHAEFDDTNAIRVETYDAIAGGPVAGQPTDGFDSIVLSNVLEHLPDDSDVLRNLAGLLSPTGSIVIFVPAFEFLYGRFDASIGHHRRYRRRTLNAAFDNAGLTAKTLRYVNMPGWFTWLITVRLLGLNPTSGRVVQIYDRMAIPAIRRLERRFAPPFGQSVLGVATR